MIKRWAKIGWNIYTQKKNMCKREKGGKSYIKCQAGYKFLMVQVGQVDLTKQWEIKHILKNIFY